MRTRVYVYIEFLSGKIILGRSHIRSVAEKRKEKINEYCRVSKRRKWREGGGGESGREGREREGGESGREGREREGGHSHAHLHSQLSPTTCHSH